MSATPVSSVARAPHPHTVLCATFRKALEQPPGTSFDSMSPAAAAVTAQCGPDAKSFKGVPGHGVYCYSCAVTLGRGAVARGADVKFGMMADPRKGIVPETEVTAMRALVAQCAGCRQPERAQQFWATAAAYAVGPVLFPSAEVAEAASKAAATPLASTEAPVTIDPKMCWKCGQAVGKKQCGRCKAARYCGAECQKAAWTGHKIVCVAPGGNNPMVSAALAQGVPGVDGIARRISEELAAHQQATPCVFCDARLLPTRNFHATAATFVCDACTKLQDDARDARVANATEDGPAALEGCLECPQCGSLVPPVDLLGHLLLCGCKPGMDQAAQFQRVMARPPIHPMPRGTGATPGEGLSALNLSELSLMTAARRRGKPGLPSLAAAAAPSA